MTGLTAVSLFAGVGGFDCALERAGVRVSAAVEIDPDCCGVLRRHFPETAIFNDVTGVTGEQLRAAGFVPGRGILAAGWPCQGNSVAGRRKGMADPRSGLWRHVVRLLDETRPRWFVGENVPGILSINGGRDFGTVLRDLDDIGYGVAWRILDAQWWGVPQRRRRVFVVGCLGDGTAPVEVLLEPEGGEGHRAPRGEAREGTPGSPGGGPGVARVTGTLTAGSLSEYDDNTARAGHLVAHALTAREGKGPDPDATSGFVVATLQGGGRRGHRIDAEGAAGGHLVPVVADTLRSHPRPGSNTTGAIVPVALRGREGGSQAEFGDPDGPAFTVRTPGGGSSYPMIAHALTSEGADASEDGTGRGTPLVTVPVAASLTAGNAAGEGVRQPGRRREDDVNLVAVGVAENQRGEVVESEISHQLTTGAGKPGQGYGAVLPDCAVRRLTPTECERLQGFPDSWTRWQDNGREQSDSARYRQLGNAVAVPVAEWVVQRIAACEAAAAETDAA